LCDYLKTGFCCRKSEIYFGGMYEASRSAWTFRLLKMRPAGSLENSLPWPHIPEEQGRYLNRCKCLKVPLLDLFMNSIPTLKEAT
jgi:hypothetical protein